VIYNPPKKIHVKPSPVHGLGIFASEDIQEGELIEIAPIAVTRINNKQPHEWSPQDLMFFKYNGGWGSWISEDLTCVAFGYASLYNHRDKPNVEYKKDFEQGAIHFYATADIEAGEECFLFYYEDYKTKFVREDMNDKEN